MKSKNINISSNKRIAYIESCKIIILIKIKLSKTSVIKSIHLQKITIIVFYLKSSMTIHHLIMFDFRNFFLSSMKLIH